MKNPAKERKGFSCPLSKRGEKHNKNKEGCPLLIFIRQSKEEEKLNADELNNIFRG